MSIIFLEFDGYCALPSLGSVLQQHMDPNQQNLDSETLCFVKTPATAAKIAENTSKIDYFVTNFPDLATLQKIRTMHPLCKTILFTDQALSSLKKEFGSDPIYCTIDHIIYSGSDEVLSRDLLRFTILFESHVTRSLADQLMNNNFNQENYSVASTHDRARVVHKLREFSLQTGVSSNLITHLCAVAEELMMNAVIDAPIAAGLRSASNVQHEEDFELELMHQPKITFFKNKNLFIIRVTDPFGLFKRESFFKYVEKIAQPLPTESLIESKSYGAGLGIYKIFHSCHALVCRVDPGRSTELTAILSLEEKLRSVWQSARTVQYFLG